MRIIFFKKKEEQIILNILEVAWRKFGVRNDDLKVDRKMIIWDFEAIQNDWALGCLQVI